MIQIDGLSRVQFDRAIAQGRLPFLAREIKQGHFTAEDFYSGVPSTTPAVQAEIFYGVRRAVPSFEFLRRSTGEVYRMYEPDSSSTIEKSLREHCDQPLLEGGCSFSNIYSAGASTTRYCAKDWDPRLMLKRINPVKMLVLGLIYLPTLVGVIGLSVLEFLIAIYDVLRGVFAKEKWLAEILFVPARIGVCIVLREMIRLRMLLAIERGVQVVHANFLGYDEQSHRRGPDSRFAHWTLKGIDRAIRDIYRAAENSDAVEYELVIYSDHGQEKTVPYERRHGRSFEEGIKEAFSAGSLADTPVWLSLLPRVIGSTVNQCRSMVGLKPLDHCAADPPDQTTHVIVTALGPLCHLYLPERLNESEEAFYAQRLVKLAGVPLVIRKSDEGVVYAHTSRGVWVLADHPEEVIGKNHPFLEDVLADLIKLRDHEDAGDLILSGWDPKQEPMSFPNENGAHGGPGYEETRGVLLLPDRIRRWHVLPHERHGVFRGDELYRVIQRYLGRKEPKDEKVKHHPKWQDNRHLRVMTYNIHSCFGTDGRIRPERVARVINQADPDIVAIQEIDAFRSRSGGHDQSKLIGEHLRMGHVFNAMLEEENEQYGIAVFSKHPFEIVRSGHLTPAGEGFMREARGAIWVKLNLAGLRLNFINTHLGLGRKERREQVLELLGPKWIGRIPETEPLILCGDFNSVPRSWVFRHLQGRLRDVHSLAGKDRPRATFSSVAPLLRLDHIFMSDHFQVTKATVPMNRSAILASDHLPLYADLSYDSSL